MNKKHKVILKFKDEAFIEQLRSLLLKTGRVKVTNLGIFEIRAVAARKGYDIATGGSRDIPASKKVFFKAAKTFRDSIQIYDDKD